MFQDNTCLWRGGPQVSAVGRTRSAPTDASFRLAGAGSGLRPGVRTEGAAEAQAETEAPGLERVTHGGGRGRLVMGRSQASRSRAVRLSHGHGLGDMPGAQGTDAEPGRGTRAHASPVPAASGCRRGRRGPGLWTRASQRPVSTVLRCSHETGSLSRGRCPRGGGRFRARPEPHQFPPARHKTFIVMSLSVRNLGQSESQSPRSYKLQLIGRNASLEVREPRGNCYQRTRWRTVS